MKVHESKMEVCRLECIREDGVWRREMEAQSRWLVGDPLIESFLDAWMKEQEEKEGWDQEMVDQLEGDDYAELCWTIDKIEEFMGLRDPEGF